MKQLLVIFLLGFLAVTTLGQTSIDLGVFGGGGTYLGDMTKIDFQKSVNPAYGAFLRYNFNPRYALRFNAVNGTIGAEGQFDKIPWSFNKNVVDVSLLFEFNYLKYMVGDKQTPWSTFIFGGIGVQRYTYKNRESELLGVVDPDVKHSYGGVIAPTIPFGLGVKYNLGKKWGVGFEAGMRKTLSDKLDDLDDPRSYVNSDGVQIKYTDQFHNNDWTSYVGIQLVYKIIGQNQNWELRTPKKRTIDWGIRNKNRKE